VDLHPQRWHLDPAGRQADRHRCDRTRRLVDEPAQRADDKKPASTRVPKAAQIALRALGEAVEECGEVPPASNHIPAKVRTVNLDQWRQYAYRRGISAGEERAKQQAFKRASDQLIASQHVGYWDGQVWLTK
jgi:hypothetical protein